MKLEEFPGVTDETVKNLFSTKNIDTTNIRSLSPLKIKSAQGKYICPKTMIIYNVHIDTQGERSLKRAPTRFMADILNKLMDCECLDAKQVSLGVILLLEAIFKANRIGMKKDFIQLYEAYGGHVNLRQAMVEVFCNWDSEEYKPLLKNLINENLYINFSELAANFKIAYKPNTIKPHTHIIDLLREKTDNPENNMIEDEVVKRFTKFVKCNEDKAIKAKIIKHPIIFAEEFLAYLTKHKPTEYDSYKELCRNRIEENNNRNIAVSGLISMQRGEASKDEEVPKNVITAISAGHVAKLGRAPSAKVRRTRYASSARNR